MRATKTVVTVTVQCDLCTCEEPVVEFAEATTEEEAERLLKARGQWFLSPELDACSSCMNQVRRRRESASTTATPLEPREVRP